MKTGALTEQRPEAAATGGSAPPASEYATDARALAVVERMRRRSPKADPLLHLPDVHPERIPRHVAIIMDGNGRWAQQRGFPRVFGHRNGAAAVRTIIEESANLGIEVLTLYSFSLENWKRPSEEIQGLMDLYVLYLDGERERIMRENIRFVQIGRREGLPGPVVEAVERLMAATAQNTGPTLCLAVNYGARAEIVDAVRAIARKVEKGELSPSAIDEQTISANLYTHGLPDPDLLIRTAGEMRVSNYLLWQISYAELYVTPTLWPDFGIPELHAAIRDFAGRKRRFGGLDKAEA
jgi:undecaprenyl diphosphate synthase